MRERLRREKGDLPLGRYAAKHFEDTSEQRRMRKRIHHIRHERGKPGPTVDPAHGISMARSDAVFIVVVKEFRFVGRHIDVHRAVAFATFARETEVERFLHGVAAPTGIERITFEHFK